jgi:hypothetical protein
MHPAPATSCKLRGSRYPEPPARDAIPPRDGIPGVGPVNGKETQ